MKKKKQIELFELIRELRGWTTGYRSWKWYFNPIMKFLYLRRMMEYSTRLTDWYAQNQIKLKDKI